MAFPIGAEVYRDGDEPVLRHIETRNRLEAPRAVGFDAQRDGRRHTLAIRIGRKQARRDCRNLDCASRDAPISAHDCHRGRPGCRLWRELVVDLVGETKKSGAGRSTPALSLTLIVVPASSVGRGTEAAVLVVVARAVPKAATMDSLASAAPLKLAAETLVVLLSAVADLGDEGIEIAAVVGEVGPAHDREARLGGEGDADDVGIARAVHRNAIPDRRCCRRCSRSRRAPSPPH